MTEYDRMLSYVIISCQFCRRPGFHLQHLAGHLRFSSNIQRQIETVHVHYMFHPHVVSTRFPPGFHSFWSRISHLWRWCCFHQASAQFGDVLSAPLSPNCNQSSISNLWQFTTWSWKLLGSTPVSTGSNHIPKKKQRWVAWKVNHKVQRFLRFLRPGRVKSKQSCSTLLLSMSRMLVSEEYNWQRHAAASVRAMWATCLQHTNWALVCLLVSHR